MNNICKKLLVLCTSIGLCASILSGCGKNSKIEVTTFPMPDGPEESAIYVEPVADISDDFIRGMDASAVLVEENSGVTYYNYSWPSQIGCRHYFDP